ncbi:SUMF1/EgtB/PvdO family nonheme iron enzyme [Desulfococcaceae bacterium HSG9]|nr:SUMF1/EgtB/PvdO family nonheme iron enzyme [Desulfococcaceae bacterium HSG9]
MTTFQILHISDLHISVKDNFDRSLVLDPLIERVKKDRDNGLKPEIVVVSGDIAFQGLAKEYELAQEFFGDLLEALELDDDRIFIVPGNHDVNRKKYRPSDIPQYENMRQLNEELENSDFRADLFKGMNDYFNYMEVHHKHLKLLDERLAPFVNIYEAVCGKRIGLAGLNSAWMCRKLPDDKKDEKKIALGEYQVSQAMKQLNKLGETDLMIAVFHHPLQWFWQKDMQRNRHYFNNTVILCGHLHDAAGGYFNGLDGRFYQFQAGGAYLSSESDWPARFTYITFDWSQNLIRLDFRKFVSPKRRWSIDGDTGDDGKKYFELHRQERIAPQVDVAPLPDFPPDYPQWIKHNFGHMDADKLYGKGDAFPLSLPEIFIPLYCDEPAEDVETLIAKSDYLLAEGRPGSGKTTLLRHLAYCLIPENRDRLQTEGLAGYLPLLIRLSEVNEFFTGPAIRQNHRQNAENILDWFFEFKMSAALSLTIASAFIKAGKAIILLDGLDELLPKHRQTVINAFVDLRMRYKDCKLVCTSRPHGINGAVVKHFANRHIKILALNREQVNLFINKWFTHFYPGTSGIGRKNADAMISAIRTHPAIDKLTDTPLMLTAICILYHDGKELPDQRAELYKKFIDNMLYRRFSDSERVHQYLKTLAFEMHEKGVTAEDRNFAEQVLQEIYTREPEETVQVYKRRIRALFDDIEPRCGLLKFGNGQYSFWHLTFQEFLCADYIKDNHSDQVKAIAPYWENKWYREVVQLYIGYVSIENKQTANDIIASVIDFPDEPPFKRWRLAGHAMLDIHPNRRIDGVVANVKNRMLEIIDSEATPVIRAESGEILGWLGDDRDLKKFIPISTGEYPIEKGKRFIKAFEIAEYPVTNTWFAEFIAAGGYENLESWSLEGKKWLKDRDAKQPKYWNNRKWKCPNAPVVGVCWYEADAFCRWLTLKRQDGWVYRLPDENEWEAAASGFDKREYPWGEWKEGHCNSGESEIKKTSPVGIFKNGKTPEGAVDMAGNVWEWTCSDDKSENILDDFTYEEELKKVLSLPVLRGGSWASAIMACAALTGLRYDPNDRNDDVGFRCSKTKI